MSLLSTQPRELEYLSKTKQIIEEKSNPKDFVSNFVILRLKEPYSIDKMVLCTEWFFNYSNITHTPQWPTFLIACAKHSFKNLSL